MLKNDFNLSKKNILFFSPDITWNQYCGNSIWAIGFLRMLKKKYKSNITAVECYRFNNKNLNNIFKDDNPDIKFIDIFSKNNYDRFSTGVDMIKTNIMINYLLFRSNNFDYIIIRGMNFMRLIRILRIRELLCYIMVIKRFLIEPMPGILLKMLRII